MLEQAVYARRNHTAILAGAFSLLLCGSAPAADTVRLGLKSEIRQLITSPDGGAWVYADALDRPRVLSVAPQGQVRSRRETLVSRGALGPDGRAWFESLRGMLRIDSQGATETFPIKDVFGEFAAGPDGTIWTTGGPALLRITPDGTATPSPQSVPGCAAFSPLSITRASDDAMWFYDYECGFVRLPRGGTPAVVATPELPAAKLVPDPQGGVWFAHHLGPGGGHVTADGRVTLLERKGYTGTMDVAVAPDGSAYYATGRCFLERAGVDGTITRHRTAVPAWHVGFDPAGGLWVASPSRLRHTTLSAPAGRCDDTPPVARIVPDPAKPISLATLRRQRGFKITVREPFAIESYVFDADADETVAGVLTHVTARRGRTVRLPVSKRLLREMANRKGTPLTLTGTFRDREGNSGSFDAELKLVP